MHWECSFLTQDCSQEVTENNVNQCGNCNQINVYLYGVQTHQARAQTMSSSTFRPIEWAEGASASLFVEHVNIALFLSLIVPPQLLPTGSPNRATCWSSPSQSWAWWPLAAMVGATFTPECQLTVVRRSLRGSYVNLFSSFLQPMAKRPSAAPVKDRITGHNPYSMDYMGFHQKYSPLFLISHWPVGRQRRL